MIKKGRGSTPPFFILLSLLFLVVCICRILCALLAILILSVLLAILILRFLFLMRLLFFLMRARLLFKFSVAFVLIKRSCFGKLPQTDKPHNHKYNK